MRDVVGFWAGMLLVIILAFWFRDQVQARDRVPAEQHQYVDEVLVPRFYAAWAAWAIDHPRDKDGHKGSQFQTIDAGDVKRGHEMRVAMKELYERLGEIGY